MLYVKSITIETTYNTKEKAKEYTIEIEEDLIAFVSVRFPPGPTNLLKVALFYGESQIFPSHKYEWTMGDNEVVWDLILYEPPESPVTLRILAYNEDDTYTHSAVVRIVAVDKIYLLGIRALSIMARGIKRLIELFTI